MNNDSIRDLGRVKRAFRYSLAGFHTTWTHEAAFRQEVVLCLLLAPVGLWLGPTPLEKALLLSCLALVLIVELLNTAVEAAIDRVGFDQHPLSARAKDIGSAAVLTALIHCIVVWAIILGLPLLGA